MIFLYLPYTTACLIVLKNMQKLKIQMKAFQGTQL